MLLGGGGVSKVLWSKIFEHDQNLRITVVKWSKFVNIDH